MKRTVLGLLFTCTLLLGVARGQDPSVDPYPVGKRVYVNHPVTGWVWPVGRIAGKNPDGTYKVELYSFGNDKTGGDWYSEFEKRKHVIPVPGEHILFTGQPTGTVDVSAADLDKVNAIKWNALVRENGKVWPKARIIADSGDKVTVEISKEDGTTETKTYEGAELKDFREINGMTAPVGLTADVDPIVKQVMDAKNKELEAAGFKLKDGTEYSKMHTVGEIVDAVHAVAEKYRPRIFEARNNPFEVFALQEEMLREAYAAFEENAGIQHGGRATTTAAFKSYGTEMLAEIRKLGGKPSSLENDLVNRAIACFQKSDVFWRIMNLADVPDLTGVGFRPFSTGGHGIVVAKFENPFASSSDPANNLGGFKIVETTEGFEDALTRASTPTWRKFPDGKGLDYMSTFDPMRAGELIRSLGTKLLDMIKPSTEGAVTTTDHTSGPIDRGFSRTGPSATTGLNGLLDDRINDAAKGPKDAAADGR